MNKWSRLAHSLISINLRYCLGLGNYLGHWRLCSYFRHLSLRIELRYLIRREGLNWLSLNFISLDQLTLRCSVSYLLLLGHRNLRNHFITHLSLVMIDSTLLSDSTQFISKLIQLVYAWISLLLTTIIGSL